MANVERSTRSSRRWRSTAVPTLLCAAAALVVVVNGTPASAGTPAAHSVSVGLPPTAVAVDAPAHTAYVAVGDGVSDQVAVVDTAHCNGHAKSGCNSDVTAVALEDGAGAAGLAFDPANHTVYVADSNSGDVTMINAATCNATTTSGCSTAPKIAALGLTSPSAVAVDVSGGADVLYVADESAGTVTVVDGATCSATKTTGCATVRTASVGAAPSAIAVDAAVGTTYVANLGDDSISTLNESACATLMAACTKVGKKVLLAGGASPSALVADPATNTLFVADFGIGALSLVNTATCTISIGSGCADKPRSLTGLAAPAGVALSPSGHVAIADSGDNRLVVVDGATCNARKTGGCASRQVDDLSGSPVAVASAGSSVYAADGTTSGLDAIAIPTIRASVTSKHHKTRFGWYRSPITVTFACQAGSAPLTAGCPSRVTLAKNGKNQVVTRSISSSDGGTATATASKLDIDRTKPTVTVTGVKNGKTYQSPPTLKCVAHDALSGVASCTIRRTHHGSAVDYVATATDKAGNARTAHGRYRVA